MNDELTAFGGVFKELMQERGMTLEEATKQLVDHMRQDGLSEEEIAFNLFDLESRIYKSAGMKRAVASGPNDPLYAPEN